MKLIFGSERQRLIRERQKYLDEYDAKKKEYIEQEGNFNESVNNYSSNMEEYIRGLLETDSAKLPGSVTINVMMADSYRANLGCTYYIKIRYISNDDKYASNNYKSGNYVYDIDSGRQRGFNWKFVTYLKTTTEDGVEIKAAETNTQINTDLIDSTDIEAMKITYIIFAKLNNINWTDVLTKINSNIPVESEYITTPDPGYKDTSKWDDAIVAYNINRVIGKDLWIKVKIWREESYDRYNSNNPGVDGNGWIKVISATEKFYQFYWLEGRYNDSDSFNRQTVMQAMRHPVKLKKIYIKVSEPVQYLSTEELIKPEMPDIGEDD